MYCKLGLAGGLVRSFKLYKYSDPFIEYEAVG